MSDTRIGVVLTCTEYTSVVEEVRAEWEKVARVVVATHDARYSSDPAYGGENPGYYAPRGVLHGHHSNLNAGIKLATGFELVITSCGDIMPKYPWKLIERFLTSGCCFGLTRANWVTQDGYELPRYQDDLMMFTRAGADRFFPIRCYNTTPHYSELGLGEHVQRLGIRDEEICLFEDLTGRFRFYWFEEHGFRHIGRDTPGVDRRVGR